MSLVTLRNGLRGCDSRHQRLFSTRNIFTNSKTTESNSFDSAESLEKMIFSGNNQENNPFYQKLDDLEKARRRTGFASNWMVRNSGGAFSDSLLDDPSTTLSDEMDGKLKRAAKYFDFDNDEVTREDYSFRPDVRFRGGTTYDIKDLDLTKPATGNFVGQEFEVTTEEVLKKADFRNVKFLSNFLTEAGIIIKRSQTRISAKAQRKVAREIKTARAFGLMPFTTMGEYPFSFGHSREHTDSDGEHDVVIISV